MDGAVKIMVHLKHTEHCGHFWEVAGTLQASVSNHLIAVADAGKSRSVERAKPFKFVLAAAAASPGPGLTSSECLTYERSHTRQTTYFSLSGSGQCIPKLKSLWKTGLEKCISPNISD